MVRASSPRLLRVGFKSHLMSFWALAHARRSHETRHSDCNHGPGIGIRGLNIYGKGLAPVRFCARVVVSNVLYKLLRNNPEQRSGRRLTGRRCITLVEVAVLTRKYTCVGIGSLLRFQATPIGVGVKTGGLGTFVAYPSLVQGFPVGGTARARPRRLCQRIALHGFLRAQAQTRRPYQSGNGTVLSWAEESVFVTCLK